jgi:multicomponent Na+:H+ antiporter subunit C
MTWSVALAAGSLVAAGLYLALGRDLLRVVVGVSLLGAGANLAVFGAGRSDRVQPPFVEHGASALAASAADPVPHALVLTAIVIGFSLTCFSLILVLALTEQTQAGRGGDGEAAEPGPRPDGTPPVLVSHD